ncbi:hypothetical protein BB737_07740 [Mycobacterium avium subsp. hominissuis]|uniref:Uncharacterized protein n=2 Tax=Mycobacterium TaxID=1763 RepID=A0A2A3LF09_MYCAV|nr:hypothetical protein [Mycobacterium kyorinense]MBZ4631375.1 hypothetical protein [Mycobacterium avium subsp. hominissuis]PBJ41616.1 hypothetical protein XV03_00100 [Mycobacterium avium subsp. hominissuis]PBJ66412.1 hypothetical protein BB737_07740 [Mycobacterium avium subsp. hominissuis]QWY65488.1 hypothetical protein BJP78_27580 [Mycobacterium avium subsp. hominissuis]
MDLRRPDHGLGSPEGGRQLSVYAWRIDRDHLGSGADEWGIGMESCVGVVGPRDARLDGDGKPNGYPHRHEFRMYDDDGELYVTGTLFWDGDAEPDESVLFGPLRDYGAGGLGCTRIAFPGRPEWEIG